MAAKYPKLSSILKKLLFEKDMKPVDLARAVDLPPPTIHRLITGKSTRPYPSSLKPIADFFSIDIDQLLGEKPLLAEDAFPDLSDAAKSLNKSQIIYLPLVPWELLHEKELNEFESKLPFFGNISDDGFATIMPDTSMEPLIQRNSIIIFDPLIKPKDRNFVLVKLHETNAYVMRQLLLDAEHQYLKPLNPDLSTFKMRLLDKNDNIIACLVEARNNFQAENNLITA